jgi:UDP-4-amino-4,6-dideoxy-N-acetyl-beta-L-altrosamine transaminase
MTQPFLGYGRQSVAQEDIDAVVAVLRGSHLTQGPAIDQFETAIAKYVGARHAVVVANGTAALHIACLAAGLKTGDRAITQAVTFVASANAAAYCDASIDAVDIDPQSLGMSVEALGRLLATRPDASVILPVHMAGLSADPAGIAAIAGSRIIIEDACHALGGQEPDGAMVGSCRHSAMTCFSFHPVKSITTGEGGAVTTNDSELFRLLRLLRSHGVERDPLRIVDRSQGFDGNESNPWYYEQQKLGFNYRMTDMQAALGLSQLKRLDTFIERRRAVAAAYDAAFADLSVLRPMQSEPDARCRSAHHLYILDIDYKAIRKSRRVVMKELIDRGIGTQVHYMPLYRQPYHREIGQPAAFPQAERYYSGCLSIPIHAELDDESVQRVVASVREVAGC